MGTRKLDELINSIGNEELQSLVQRAERLSRLATTLSHALPPELAGDIVAANVRDEGELVVVCRSPARAARIRYESGTLLAAASSAGENVTHVTVRVARM